MNHEQVREVAAKFSLPILQSGAFTLFVPTEFQAV